VKVSKLPVLAVTFCSSPVSTESSQAGTHRARTKVAAMDRRRFFMMAGLKQVVGQLQSPTLPSIGPEFVAPTSRVAHQSPCRHEKEIQVGKQ
jgi:hypothetical protein